MHDQARKLLEQPGGAYQPELVSFDLTEIRLTPDALVLVIEFRMVIN